MKKIVAFLFVVFHSTFLYSADSDIRINEIAATPVAASEWVEIYNRGSVSVDMRGWRFWEAGVNHGLTLSQGSFVIPPGGYAIIANSSSTFLLNHPGFSGTVFDSVWTSLSTSGEEIGLKNSALSAIEIFTYPAHSTGTLERANPDWTDASSSNWQQSANSNGTPGAVNDRKWFAFYSNEPPSSKGIDLRLVEQLNGASIRIHASIYQLNLQNVVDAMIAGSMLHEVTLSGEPKIIQDPNGLDYAYEYTWDTSGIASGVYIVVVVAKKSGEQDIRVMKKIGLVK